MTLKNPEKEEKSHSLTHSHIHANKPDHFPCHVDFEVDTCKEKKGFERRDGN